MGENQRDAIVCRGKPYPNRGTSAVFLIKIGIQDIGSVIWSVIRLIVRCLQNYLLMSDNNYPVPPSHRTFVFGKVTVDSNFDSGNCSYAERVSPTTYAIWLASDHVKNTYRVWFYFSIVGIPKGSVVNFQIKNMQNQSKLIEEGLVPVVREESSQKWKRISHNINLTNMVIVDNEMEWIFTHQFVSSERHYFAFCPPWSNLENSLFLDQITAKTANIDDIYFHRGIITNSLQGRPIELLTVSSKKGLTQREQTFDDPVLFANSSRPRVFEGEKRCVIIGARVHPGQVPSSHVMCGIIDELTESSRLANALRDNFVFYIMPIFNPDGVARGHFRVDVNGINLNRCYINPSVKEHSSIYAIKKVIMHCHVQEKYFAFMDLHAQPSRRGNFVYGNSLNELNKQVEACLFPRILSMNSQNFEYEGSNFMEKHMYSKDKGDHVSKEGCGRVAMYHATKNPNSWTVQCSYINGQKSNILEPKKQPQTEGINTNEESLDFNLIKNYKVFPYQEAKEFYDIGVYRKLGKEILQSLLDLIQANPESRITNPQNYFKNIANIRLNLAMALIKMAPNRFEPYFRKIYFMLQGTENEKIIKRCYQALYFLIVRKAKIPYLVEYLKEDDNTILYPPQKTTRQISRRKAFTNSLKTTKKSMSPSIRPIRPSVLGDENDGIDKDETASMVITSEDSPDKTSISFAGGLRKNNPVINVVEIDKQIFLKKMNKIGKMEKDEHKMGKGEHKMGKDEYKMLAVCNQQGRYQSQQQITNFSNYKKKGNHRGEDLSMRKTSNEVFRLQILPKLMMGSKQMICVSPLLKHHQSLKF